MSEYCQVTVLTPQYLQWCIRPEITISTCSLHHGGKNTFVPITEAISIDLDNNEKGTQKQQEQDMESNHQAPDCSSAGKHTVKTSGRDSHYSTPYLGSLCFESTITPTQRRFIKCRLEGFF